MVYEEKKADGGREWEEHAPLLVLVHIIGHATAQLLPELVQRRGPHLVRLVALQRIWKTTQDEGCQRSERRFRTKLSVMWHILNDHGDDFEHGGAGLSVRQDHFRCD